MRNEFTPSTWWRLGTGPSNTLSDVSGVRVGHESLRDDGTCTGVTAIVPHAGDLHALPVPAGVSVLNGFGKSAGLLQVQELGEIESPILLTNTLSVPACVSELHRRAIANNAGIGRQIATFNPLVLECNDGRVNDIQAMAVTAEHARRAIEKADVQFEQGTVGAGSGMCTFGYAGGIGSSSRRVVLQGGSTYMLGVLVLSNFGQTGELRVFGEMVTDTRSSIYPARSERGSIIILIATDGPLDSRQLTRLSRRSGAAMGRLGSFYGHGSGDITVSFSLANARRHGTQDVYTISRLCESRMDSFFVAAVEATEEAILNAIWHAEPRTGYDGSLLPGFRHHWQSGTLD